MKVLFSTSSTQAPLYLTASINLCSHTLSSLSSSTSHTRTPPFATIWRLFFKLTRRRSSTTDITRCLWQDLKPVDVTNKRSLWENKGASPTKVAMIHFKLFTSPVPVSPIGGKIHSVACPGGYPDEASAVPNWLVVLEGFPVVSPGFPVVVNQEGFLPQWCRWNIKMISQHFDPGVAAKGVTITCVCFLFFLKNSHS